MREIKFRIRNLKESCVDHIWGDSEEIFIRASDGKAFYFDGFANEMLEYDEQKNICIEQFTGLKDKNGKEIYDGDILQYLRGLNTRLNAVEFSEGAFFCGYHEGSSTRKRIKLIQSKTCVVVGNIHENPGLLDGAE